MPTKTQEQLNHAKRTGLFGESLVLAFLQEYANFCYPTCEGHPADLIVEFGNNSLYKVQVKTRNKSVKGNYIFPFENHRNMSEMHRSYHIDVLAFVFLPQKRIIFKPFTGYQKYHTYKEKDLIDNIENISFEKCLESLNNVPKFKSFLGEAEKKEV